VNAEKLYERRKRDITTLLCKIAEEVGHHAEYSRTEGGPTAEHARELVWVRGRLIKILAEMSGQDEDFVKETLAETTD
jgi:hypothetical protein